MSTNRFLATCTAAWLTLLGLQLSPASAQPTPDGPPPGAGGGGPATPERSLHVEARALFGPASLCPGGFGEVLVRIANTGQTKATGEVLVHGGGGAGMTGAYAAVDSTRAPFAVAAGATVSIRLPVRVAEHDEPVLVVADAEGRSIHRQSLPRGGGPQALLVDVHPASALGAQLRGMPVPARLDPFQSPYGGRGWSGSGPLIAEVSSAAYDGTTGDPLLPHRAAAYCRVAALLIGTDTLVRTPLAELEALTSYLLAGGTVALVVARPEDLRHPTVAALAGGEVAAGPPGAATLRELTLSAAGGSGSFGGPPDKQLPSAAGPEPEVRENLSGYTGGNLRPSLYGSSAAYGLGEVHLLAVDPTRKPAVDSPFVQLRMIDLLRRATERRSATLLFPGGYHNPVEQVRRTLDPNEGSRWAIVLAALLLCIYAVLAGPLNFAFWRRRGRPLRALLYLPLLSGATFGLVVVTGVAAKGCRGRARHLTLVEAGAGMPRGTARRWRGFFVPTARKLDVSASHASSVVSSARMDLGDTSTDQLLVDRDGLRLADVPLRPWQTAVVREDGWVDLGTGIALLPAGPNEVVVDNGTDRKLRGLMLQLPSAKELSWLDELAPGATASSKQFSPLSGALGMRTTPSGLSLADFHVYAARDELERVSDGLGDAWDAIASATTAERSWFPGDVPTLLAQLDGGEGRTADAGLPLDSDRVLIRVVGLGGEP